MNESFAAKFAAAVAAVIEGCSSAPTSLQVIIWSVEVDQSLLLHFLRLLLLVGD